MSVRWPVDSLYLAISTKGFWDKQATKQLYYLCRPKLFWRINHAVAHRHLHTSKQHCKWIRGKILWYNKYLYCHDFLCYKVSKLSTSKDLPNNRMSRFKNTLESVSKAVIGTHSELVSRLARLKPYSDILNKSIENNGQENSLHMNLGNNKQTADTRTREDYNDSLDFKKAVSVSEDVNPNGANQSSLTELADLKNSLFHVSYFATNFGETYNFLANHINWYFGSSVMDQQKKGNAFPSKLENAVGEKLDLPEEDIISNVKRIKATTDLMPAVSPDTEKINATPPTSSKKSIANILSYPSNTVQAFVDNYIGGLVPKLRSDAKPALQEKSKVQECEEALKDDEETKSAEEKEKRLSLQREKASHFHNNYFTHFLPVANREVGLYPVEIPCKILICLVLGVLKYYSWTALIKTI